ARVVLEAAGFLVQQDSVESDEPRGRVVGVEPAVGTQLPMPGDVRLMVSEGPPQVLMPSVTGLTEEEARELLETLGLLVSVSDGPVPDGGEAGRVVEQVPAAEEPLERGSAVRIVVGRGGEPPGPGR